MDRLAERVRNADARVTKEPVDAEFLLAARRSCAIARATTSLEALPDDCPVWVGVPARKHGTSSRARPALGYGSTRSMVETRSIERSKETTRPIPVLSAQATR